MIAGEYDVAYDHTRGELSVEAHFESSGARFGVERGAERFVRDLDASRAGDAFTVRACESGPCTFRYRFALREAARAIDDLDVASREGELLEAPPSTWLLAPTRRDDDAKIRFRVRTPNGITFATGVFPSAIPGTWEISLGDLVTSPYSAFGPMRLRTVKTHGASLELAIAQGTLSVTDDEVAAWTEASARAVSLYYGRFPMPSALVLVVPGRSGWVGGGRTLAGGGGAVFMRVGELATISALREDWVLVHEMTHLGFPSGPREANWAEEGLATYVEPFARVRAGLLRAEDAWLGLAEGLPHGLPRRGDRGLDRTPTWGRTYWGGALFYLLADVAIRTRSSSKLGLEDALAGILAAGGSNAVRWPTDRAFAAGDRAIGFPVLTELHAAMGKEPHPVDLDALLRALGVIVEKGSVRFDEAAPLAGVRRAITQGTRVLP